MSVSVKFLFRLGLAALALPLATCDKQTPVAPSLSATCSASPGSGTAPLAVSFVLNVAGAQGAISVRINYGDGSSGTDVGASHVYTSAGSYTASFEVQTPTQSALCTAAIQVAARPAPAATPTPPAANREPEIHFRTTPEPTAGLTFDARKTVTIQFNMCTSSDPDGDPLNFRMDFEGDGKLEVDGPTGADCRRSHTYTQTGPVSPTIYSPRMCATDLLPSRTPAHPYRCRSYTVKVYW